MTAIAAPESSSPPPPDPLPAAVPAAQTEGGAPQPWLAQVMLDTVGRTGARFGLAWVLTVAFFAVFSPFLASSHPYFLRTNDPQLVASYGRVSSPLLRHLNGTDVTLLVFAVACVWLYFARRLTVSAKLVLACLVLAVVIPAAHWKPLLDYLRDVGARRGQYADLSRRGADVRLVGMAFLLLIDAAVAVWALTAGVVPGRAKAWAVALLVALTGLLIYLPVNPPVLVNYQEYRQAVAAGHVQKIVYAPLPYSPTDRLNDLFDLDHPPPQPPSRQHWLGTESYGADILSRMMHACRIAMAIGFIATGISIVIGVIVGGLMGFFVGYLDLIGMRLVEIFGSVPTLYLLLAFVAFFPRNLYLMMVIIGFTGWVDNARFVRAEFLRLRNQDFVHAARAAGLPLRSILFRHMLPNAMAPLLVSASFGIAQAILIEATLSYLGLGLVDDPSWGQLLNQAVSEAGVFSWWLATFPGLAIFLTVFSYNLIGEAVRDALDPKLKRTG
jgi:peptide/nickel transport system permease protein